MAGELILPQKLNMRSVDWTATADTARGDLVELTGGLVGFALGEAKATETVAVGIEADLVTVPQPDTARAWKAGEQVFIDVDGKTSGPRDITRAKLGFVHHDTAATEARIPIVWLPDYGRYYQELTEETTPALSVTAPAGQQQRLDLIPQHWETNIVTTTLKGIREGVPVHVTYEGAIRSEINKNVETEIIVSYFLWESIPSKIATIEHTIVQTTRSGEDYSASLDNFSIHFNLKVGDLVPRGRLAAGAVTEVTRADFTNGIPVRLALRVRGLVQGNAPQNTTRLAKLQGEEMQMITIQQGPPTR